MPNIPKGTLCISNEQEESGVNFMRVAIFFFFDCRDAIRNNQKKKKIATRMKLTPFSSCSLDIHTVYLPCMYLDSRSVQA